MYTALTLLLGDTELSKKICLRLYSSGVKVDVAAVADKGDFRRQDRGGRSQ